MDIVNSIAGVRAQVKLWRSIGHRVAFVPTMGNLHAGHMSLLAAARHRAQRTIVSVFVNPLQFGPKEDFAQYPRTPDEDEQLLREAHCDLLFRPEVAEIYPEGGTQSTLVSVRSLSTTLCGEFRPGHFDGVATVVAKLFGIVAPDVAVFGEKDFQQFLVIQQMTRELAIPVEVVGAPTVRAADGLALSSRNRYLSADDRARAPAIYQALRAAAGALAARFQASALAGGRELGALLAEVESAGRSALERAAMKVDYFNVRDAHDLQMPRAASQELVILTAARLGRSRLIDNLRLSLARAVDDRASAARSADC